MRPSSTSDDAVTLTCMRQVLAASARRRGRGHGARDDRVRDGIGTCCGRGRRVGEGTPGRHRRRPHLYLRSRGPDHPPSCSSRASTTRRIRGPSPTPRRRSPHLRRCSPASRKVTRCLSTTRRARSVRPTCAAHHHPHTPVDNPRTLDVQAADLARSGAGQGPGSVPAGGALVRRHDRPAVRAAARRPGRGIVFVDAFAPTIKPLFGELWPQYEELLNHPGLALDQDPTWETVDADEAIATLAAGPPLPSVPFRGREQGVALRRRAGRPADVVARLEQVWPQVQDTIVQEVGVSQPPHVIATGSDHYVQMHDPDLVIATVEVVLDRIAAKRKKLAIHGHTGARRPARGPHWQAGVGACSLSGLASRAAHGHLASLALPFSLVRQPTSAQAGPRSRTTQHNRSTLRRGPFSGRSVRVKPKEHRDSPCLPKGSSGASSA